MGETETLEHKIQQLEKKLEREQWENCWLRQRLHGLEARLRVLSVATAPAREV